MPVVSVEDGLTLAQLVDDGPEHSRIQAGAPLGRPHPHTSGIKTAGQLALAAGHDHLSCAQQS
jgi:hypothetical protein